ncbi:hypothetical protein MHY13_03385 [Corynebacterium sp. ACRPE]|uniref:hypothetical protein n=1 Tax=Corynebacterium sp. ACRPE TaxID=2918196 RepID=UPI001EF52840|nr:hypothetical protein [Corynebacterium sp. ACRPE]MCG7467176.1 hypothetical protein [Corynebacterium sp. ACRPE]
MTTAVDEAMAAATSDTAQSATAPAVDDSRRGEPVGGEHGPLSEEQAEKLLQKAFKAATTFADVMQEILDRKAWTALGYSNPRDMIRERFTGKLINPHTGNPYDRGYVRRMSNSAWMVWSLSELCDVPPSELHVVTSVLARIPSGGDGRKHQKLVDNIMADIEQRGITSVEGINAVIDSHLTTSSQQREVTKPDGEEVTAAVDEAEADLTPEEGSRPEKDAPTSDSAASASEPKDGMEARYGEADEAEDWQNQVESTREDNALAGEDNSTPDNAGDKPGEGQEFTSATDAFDAEFAAGSQAPQQRVTWEDALEAVRSTEAVTTNVQTMATFPQVFGDMAEKVTQLCAAVTETVNGVVEVCHSVKSTAKISDAEGLFDALDDKELDKLREDVQTAVASRALIEAAGGLLSGFEGIPEAPDNLDKAAEATKEADAAVENLEGFLEEMDFLY